MAVVIICLIWMWLSAAVLFGAGFSTDSNRDAPPPLAGE